MKNQMPDLCVGIDKANIGKGYDEWEAGVTEEKVILWSETCALVQNYHTPLTWTRCYLDQNNHGHLMTDLTLAVGYIMEPMDARKSKAANIAFEEDFDDAFW